MAFEKAPDTTEEFEAKFFLPDEAATQALARDFAEACEHTQAWQDGLVVYLEGNLGAGKSCFSRALIQTFLPNQAVKSPTYTLVESYSTLEVNIHHFDLYRLCDPEELEFLGLRDLLTPPFMALVEWPSKGKGVFSAPDVIISLQIEDSGRRIAFKCLNNKAKALVKKLAK